jgi:ATP-dependent helicase HrpB
VNPSPPRTSLPIDPLLPEIVRALEKNNAAVVTAEPGAGKTTRVPPALLSASFVGDREIWVLQPRRIAAKMAALRVADEMGDAVGRRVGYRFRFEKCVGRETRLIFMTDGMLLPLAQSDPALKRVAAVALDEFHERSLALDLGIGWLKRLQDGSRPDLRLLVMSATLDAGALSSYLGGCPVFKSEGKVFPVTVEYHPQPREADLAMKVKSAVRHLSSRGDEGTTLVFLPGLYEIKQAARALEGYDAEVRMLYGDLPVEEQQKILGPASGRKIILSTNVAETSLTVPGVTAVVDSGLTRQSRVSPWSGLESLVTVSASQASSTQRAGRAGRLKAGTCLRLYTQFDFEHRAPFDLPELMRADLSKALLDLLLLGIADFDIFPWFQKPTPAALDTARDLLKRLGAVDEKEGLSPAGRRMARMSVHPRLARFLLKVEELAPKNPSVQRMACRMAAMISEERAGTVDLPDEFEKYKPGFEARRLEDQLALWLENDAGKADRKPVPSEHALLAKGLLAAFPDRVAKARPAGGRQTRDKTGKVRELLLSQGGSATAPDSALLREHEYFVMVEAQETASSSAAGALGARAQAKARSLCPIEVDWLLDFFSGELAEEETCKWNDESKRVEGSRRLKYGALVLDEKPLGPGTLGKSAEELLYKHAVDGGVGAYCDPEALSAFLNRVRFVAERDKGFPEMSDERARETLRSLCAGRLSLKDLREANLVAALREKLAPQQRSLLDQLAPTHADLRGRRRVEVNYEPGKPPWLQSRIQDFFGMPKGPAVFGGEVPLVLHLLAPNKRAVQVTSDLAGFWVNQYPQVRKEFMRRYPRHSWPEKPA